MSSPDIVRLVSGTFLLYSTTLLWSSVPSKLISTQSLWQAGSLFASCKRKGMLRAWLRGACWCILCHINGIAGRSNAEHVVSHLHFHLTEKLRYRFPAEKNLVQSLFLVAMEVVRHFRCWLCHVFLLVPQLWPLSPCCLLKSLSSLFTVHLTSWQAVWLAIITRLAGPLPSSQFLLWSKSLLYHYYNKASTMHDCNHSADSREYLNNFGNL